MSRLLKGAALAALLVIALAGAASATSAPKYRLGHLPTLVAAGSCAFGAAFPDLCSEANQNSSFTVQSRFGQTFQALASADGQVWTSAHPQPFNLPGDDTDPVGYDKTHTLTDWTTASYTGIRAGCTFNASGNALTGGPWLSCASGTPDLEDLDGCTAGGMVIRISGTLTSLKVWNNKICNGANSNVAGGYNISSVAGASGQDIDVEFNEFDGGHAAFPCSITASYAGSALTVSSGGSCGANVTLNKGALIGGGTLTLNSGGRTAVTLTSNCVISGGTGSCTLTGNAATGGPSTLSVEMADWEGPIDWGSINCNVTIKHNAFLNQPAMTGSVNGIGCNVDYASNYSYPIGLNTLSSVHLATIIIGTGNTLNATVTSMKYRFNVSGYGRAGDGEGSTCFSVNGTTGKNSVFASVDIEGNTCVSNLLTGGGVSTSSALFFLNAAGAVGNLTAKDNFVSPHGAQSCISNQSNTLFAYFVDDGKGGGTYDGVAGNVLTITEITTQPNQGAVYVGGTIGSTSVVYGVLAAYGTVIPGTATPTTGTGGAGSYVIGGAARAVPQTGNGAGKEWDVPVTGTLSTDPGNQVATNLLNGEVIAIAGTQWNGGNCTTTP